MEKEHRKKIAEYSMHIDRLESTLDLIKTSTVLCFTTMDRGPDETVSIEFTNAEKDENEIISTAKELMERYLEKKISELNEKIDGVLEKN